MRAKWTLFFILISLGLMLVSQEEPKLLRVKETSAANMLLVNAVDLEKIVTDFMLGEIAADIELVDKGGAVTVPLAVWKKGKIKLEAKTNAEGFMTIALVDPGYGQILEKVRNPNPKSGYQVVARASKAVNVIKSRDIYFAEFPDLVIKLKFPVAVKPGKPMGGDLGVLIENRGTTPSAQFNIKLVISSDTQIPAQPGPVSKTFKEDTVLENAELVIPQLNGGESMEMAFPGPVAVPTDTSPGKYYLAALADPEGKIAELNRDNNQDIGFFLITAPVPKSFTIELPETQLIYYPNANMLNIECQGAEFSTGKDWRNCRMRSDIYQIKHVNWPETLHWAVFTLERRVYEIRGVDFCKFGGSPRQVPIRVEVRGGSQTAPPSQFILKFTQAKLTYQPAERKIQLTTNGLPIDYLPFWRAYQVEPHLYQLKYNYWTDFYWEVDTYKKQITQVTGSEMDKKGGERKILPYTLTIELAPES